MTIFSAAVDALFADPNIGRDAVFTPVDRPPVAVRAIMRRADELTNFGDARLWSETIRLDLRVTEAPEPRPGDRIEIAATDPDREAEIFIVQGEPVRDRERLVWTVSLRPVCGNDAVVR